MFLGGPSLAGLLLLSGLLVGWQYQSASAQDWVPSRTLPAIRFRNGEETLRVFAPVSAAVRHSIVKLNVDGETVALGTVVEAGGLVLSKASEIKPGKLTCWLATEKEVGAEVIGVDADEDVALVRVRATGLKPISWSTTGASLGQWAISPGIADTPHAVGIISALPRRIRPQRSFIGVIFDFNVPQPTLETLLPGLGAERAGLKPGDVILSVNSKAVTNRDQVVEMLGDYRAGQGVMVRVQRGAEQFDTQLKMMRLPSRNEVSEPPSERFTGQVSQRAEGFDQAIEHDSVLPPWLCGGPLVNIDGKAIGLNIARAGRVTTYALPANLVQRILDNLKARKNQH